MASLVRRPLVAVVAATAVLLVALSAAERPDAFFSGDSGLKLIASFSAIAHPTRPLEIDLPSVGGRPVPYVEHMISLHGDHGHVLQSPIFPVLSAPLIRAFGVRGAYVLPIVSFIALLPLLDAMRRHTMPETSFAVLAWIAIAANPVVFYALEYWEHAPAIALLAASVCAALLARTTPSSARRWMLVSGALGGCSVLLRPEAAWGLASMLLIVERRHWLTFALSTSAVMMPFGIANLVHSGNVLGPHASQSLAPLASDWMAARASRIRAWLWPESLIADLGLLLVAASWIAGAIVRDIRVGQLVGLSGTAIVSVVASQRWLLRDSLWQAFPVVLLAFIATPATPLVRRLQAIAVITGIGVVLTATHDGGAQWGPRFLLISAPVLLVLAARGASHAAGRGRVRALRLGLIAVILAAGLWTERSAYLELRGAKRLYGRIVSATSTLTDEGSVILTNVWWFDQVNASLYGRRVFLFVPTPAAATQALNALADANVQDATMVWTEEPDGEPLTEAIRDTCFEIDATRVVPDRKLRFASAHCRR